MMPFCESNSILSDYQLGFRQKHSCELALNTLVDDRRTSLDNRKSVIAVFLDLRNAFDMVDHTLLLLKLKYYGVSESLCSLTTIHIYQKKSGIGYGKG